MITAHIASLPERVDTLKKTINSLLPQVDGIYVSLNNYEEVPLFLKKKRIISTLCDNSLGAEAKFLRVNDFYGYTLVCDDDLIYPDNYVEYMINKVEAHKGIVSLLGKVYSTRPTKSYRRGYTDIYRCLVRVEGDHEVDVCGTGAMAYHSRDIEINIKDFGMRNMADVWMAKIAHEQGVKMFAVEHDRDFVKHVLYPDRIWVGTVDDTVQTMVLNSFLK